MSSENKGMTLNLNRTSFMYIKFINNVDEPWCRNVGGEAATSSPLIRAVIVYSKLIQQRLSFFKFSIDAHLKERENGV